MSSALDRAWTPVRPSMFLIDDIVLMPVKGVVWLCEKILEAAEEEQLSDVEEIKARLSELYMLLDTGVIDEESFAREEGSLLDRLDALEGGDGDEEDWDAEAWGEDEWGEEEESEDAWVEDEGAEEARDADERSRGARQEPTGAHVGTLHESPSSETLSSETLSGETAKVESPESGPGRAGRDAE